MLPLNKIICGDALASLQVLRSNSVHLVVTSPPYNLSKPYANHDDEMDYPEYLDWMGQVWREVKRVLVPSGRLCINIGENKRQNITYPTFSAFIQQCIEAGYLYRGTVIWNKNSAAKHCAWGSWNSASNPHIVPRHEYILAFSKDDFRLEGRSDDCDLDKDLFMTCTRSVWAFGTESKTKIGHPAPFPKELPARLIKFYSFVGNVVLDMFAGSGTVGVTARQLGRNFILIDNSPEYCELALNRIHTEAASGPSDDPAPATEIVKLQSLRGAAKA